MYKLESIRCVQAGEEAQTVKLNGRACLVQNNSESDIYFKEKHDDGADASAANGWKLAAGGETRFPMTIRELSVIAEAEDCDVRILTVED